MSTVAAFLVLFLGGASAGVWLAETFAPDSWIAAVAGLFALPLAFAVSLQAWYGLALLGLVPRLLRMAAGATPRPQASLPGTFVFLPASSAASLIAGLIVGLASPTHPFWLVVLIYWLLGTAHGALGRRLARAGVLMPPESI